MVGAVDALEVSNPPTADDLEKIAERVPDLRGYPLRAEPLPGGLTNLNYRIHGAPSEYVLRVTGEAEMLGADRENEYTATVIAGGLGIGPKVLAYLRPEKILITDFVDGVGVPAEQLRTTAMIGQVAATLRRLHEGPPVPGSFSAFAIVETYRDNARWLGVELPDAFEWSWERAGEMRAALEASPREPCLCHNDLLNANFLLQQGRLLIVDWEYAGMGDPFFDLANFSTNHDLSEDDDRVLLRAYLGRVRERDMARLRLMRIMSDFREAMWGVVQQGLRTTDADYAAYAERFFGRLREGATDDRYPRWIEHLAG
jgi:thiamine kinase-like enzyme